MNMPTYSFPRSLIGLTLTTALTLATSAASAAVLYEQAPRNLGTGYYANLNTPQQIADDFALGGAVDMERITWWGGYDANIDGNDDDFLVRLYSGLTGTGSVQQEFSSVAFSRTPTGLSDGAHNDIYQYDFVLGTPVALSPGIYYLFVQNLGSSDWLWLEGNPGSGDSWGRGEDTDDWTNGTGDLALRIEGTQAQTPHIPEPSSLALLGIASLSLAMAIWRRQRRVIQS